jgi:hypothetical protein
MLDVFFLSYNEPYADEHYELLLKKAPHARRVNGVKGFTEAHQECARRSLTNNFYVVDSDAVIVDDFDFYFTPSKYNTWWGIPESECLCLWTSVNPINDLKYGHGGVKLLPKQKLLTKNPNTVDFTTGFGLSIKFFDQVSNITKFNYDEFNTWRSAFRECSKLETNLTNEELRHKLNYDEDQISQFIKETKARLKVWTTKGKDKPFGQYAIEGARAGKSYGDQHRDDSAALKLINDIEWMKNEFIKFYKQQ